MTRPFLVTQGEFAASTTIAFGGTLNVPLAYHQKDDIIVLVLDYFPLANTPLADIVAPAGWSASTSVTYGGDDRLIQTYSSVTWWWRRAADSSTPTPQITLPTYGSGQIGAHVSACAFVIRGCVTFGDPFEGRDRTGVWEGDDDIAHQAVTSTHADATAFAIISATNSAVASIGASPAGFDTKSLKYSFLGEGASCVVLSRDIDIGSIASAWTGYKNNQSAGNTATWAITFTFVAIPTASVGVPTVPSTAVPIRGMARGTPAPPVLGCASEYEAIITGNDYETRIDAVRFASLNWERVLDDISTASVVIPDEFGGVACCAKYGGLVPWRYGLTIERDGEEVWRGPVTNVKRGRGQITVRASDCFVRFRKRIATRTDSLRYVNNDTGQMFADILNIHARVPTDAWVFRVPQPTTGVPVTRNVVAREFSTAWDIVEDLLDSAIDTYVLAGQPVVFQPNIGWLVIGALDEQYYLNTDQASTVTTGGDTVYGLFTQEAFSEIPEWEINGMLQANTGWLTAADSGQGGFRKFWAAQVDSELPFDSVLDIVETAQLYRAGEDEEVDDSVFQRRIESLVALRAVAPAVIDAVSLSSAAPINVANLRPGSIWLMDVHDACWGQLLAAGRLKRVSGSVTTTGGTVEETIGATLQPLGYTEADL